MRSKNCPVHTTYNYSRRSLQKPPGVHHNSEQSSPRDDINVAASDSQGCSCDLVSEGEHANILHKKCPVITLAQQQLQRLLIERDNFTNENSRCRTVCELYLLCKNLILIQDKHKSIVLLGLIFLTFISGLIIGAASCGTYLGRFNSPILTCIDNYFIADVYGSIEDSYRAIL